MRNLKNNITIHFKTNAPNEDEDGNDLFDHMALRFFCDDGDDYYPDDLDLDYHESEQTWTGCVQYDYPDVGKLETTILFEVQRSGFPAFHIDKSCAHVCHPTSQFATKPSAAANAVTRYSRAQKCIRTGVIQKNSHAMGHVQTTSVDTRL